MKKTRLIVSIAFSVTLFILPSTFAATPQLLLGTAAIDEEANNTAFSWGDLGFRFVVPPGPAYRLTSISLPLQFYHATTPPCFQILSDDGTGNPGNEVLYSFIAGPKVSDGPATYTHVAADEFIFQPSSTYWLLGNAYWPIHWLGNSEAPIGIATVIGCRHNVWGPWTDYGYGISFQINVVPLSLAFDGFLPPVDGADETGGSFTDPLRTFKLGSTIPVKFAISEDGAPVTTGVHTLAVVKYSDATTDETPIDATPRDGATSGNQFRLSDGQWVFNLDSGGTGMSIGIWLLKATLSDGTTHTAWIQLK